MSTLPARAAAHAAPLLLCVLLAACGDAPPTLSGGGSPPPPPVPSDALAVLRCDADLRTATLSCAGEEGGAGGSANRIIGGQGVNVLLTSTNVVRDTAGGLLSADVTVKNLLLQRMGTDDGADTTGVRVFFHSGPRVTAGSGAVSVRNFDGAGTYTGTGQPYFHYDDVLARDQVSAARRWEFDVAPTVAAFSFSVFVRAELLPVVVFDRRVGGNRDLWRVALDGSDLVRLTSAAADDLDPAPSRDRVAWVSYRDGNAELYDAPLAGGTPRRLTSTAAPEAAPALTRDGARLAFTREVGGVTKLFTAGGDGAGAARATAAFGYAGSVENSPSWSPDGSRAAFVATADGTADVWSMDAADAFSLLAGGGAADVEPAWSPDGTRVAFASTRGGGDTELWLLTLSTGALTRLTSRAGTDASPAWTEDGRIVYGAWSGATPALRWLDPADPSVTHPIPTGTEAASNPAVVPF